MNQTMKNGMQILVGGEIIPNQTIMLQQSDQGKEIRMKLVVREIVEKKRSK